MKQKLLFFYLHTGGGHLAPAKAVAQVVNEKYEGYQVVLQDGFEKSPKFISNLIVDGYKNLQSYAPKIYEILYALNKNKVFTSSTINNIHKIIKYDILDIIEQQKPDKIVIFHSFLIKPIIKALKNLDLNIPVIVVVTDPITPPPIWFLNKELFFVVFSKQAKKYALEEGVKEENIKILNFPLDGKFSKSLSEKEKLDFKIKNNLPTEKPTVLILGGADGLPKGKKIVKRLVELAADIHIVIVCGRNKELYYKIEKYISEKNISNVTVLGYINYVYELMQSSDIVISKCGASTFMEILLSKKVPIISSYLWEQEKGNVEFIVDNDMGFYETSTKKIAKIVNKLISNREFYEEIVFNIDKAKLKNGNKELADFIINFGGNNEDSIDK